MKMKEMFEKVEAYNEIAGLVHTEKAKIQFSGDYYSERFDNYIDFKKYVRREFIKEVADQVLKSEDWEIDGKLEFQYGSGIFADTAVFSAEIVTNY